MNRDQNEDANTAKRCTNARMTRGMVKGGGTSRMAGTTLRAAPWAGGLKQMQRPRTDFIFSSRCGGV